jgi:hypothetical protein
MRYRVNPVSEELERLPPEELGPPYPLLHGRRVQVIEK